MTEITVSDGRVCIVKATEVTSVKDGLEAMKNALSDFATSDKIQESNLDTFLFVDLSGFNIINSSLIGIFGSLIMDDKINLLALCGIQPSVENILKRFGVISDDSGSKDFATYKMRENLGKVVIFDSIDQGLVYLNPA
jgi:hypothetical protein